MTTTTLPAPATLDDAKAQADAVIEADAPPAKAPKAKRPPRKRPPRARAPKKDAAPRSSAPRASSLKAQLEEAITSIGFLVMFANGDDGRAIMAGAPKQADALANWAKKNPAVDAALRRMLAASDYGAIVFAFAPTALAIAANHGLFGASSPMVGMIAGMASAPTTDPADDPAPIDLGALASMFSPAPSPAPPAAEPVAPEGGNPDGAPFARVAGADAVVGVH